MFGFSRNILSLLAALGTLAERHLPHEQTKWPEDFYPCLFQAILKNWCQDKREVKLHDKVVTGNPSYQFVTRNKKRNFYYICNRASSFAIFMVRKRHYAKMRTHLFVLGTFFTSRGTKKVSSAAVIEILCSLLGSMSFMAALQTCLLICKSS